MLSLCSNATVGPAHILAFDTRSNSTPEFCKSVNENHLTIRQSTPTSGGMRPGDREAWLLRYGLPSVPSKDIVIMLDTSDIVIQCSYSEIVQKFQNLVRSFDNEILIGGEATIWPRHFPKKGYPSSHKSRFINIGTIIGRAEVYMRMLTCMKTMFGTLPSMCPVGTHPDGTYIMRKSTYKYESDQSCYHMYFVNQHTGRLPHMCPKFVIDHTAEIIVALPKVSEHLRFYKNGIHYSGKKTCLLHAAGSSKIVLPTLFAWKEKLRGHNVTIENILKNTRTYSKTIALKFYRSRLGFD